MGERSPIHVLIVIARRNQHYNQVDAVESDKSMMIECPGNLQPKLLAVII